MNKALIGASAVAVLFASACGADPLFQNESDAVITIQAKGSDFSGYKTYYLPTKIVDLCLQPQSGTPTSEAIGGAAGGPSIDPGSCWPTDHASDAAILSALARNMDDRGYERVAEEEREDADLALLPGLVSKLTWSLSRPYCFPNSFYPGCVSQDGNPEAVVPLNSLVVQLIDVDGSTTKSLDSQWTAAVHQLEKIKVELGTSMGGGPASTKSKLMIAGVDQAFAQSPYLAAGGGK